MKKVNAVNKYIKSALIISAMLSSGGLHANVFLEGQSVGVIPQSDTTYFSTPQVVPEQAQLIYYYPASVNAGPLNIYLDKEFHTALLPGEFTTLCVSAGQHTLAAAVNDAPLYQQKANAGVNAQFNGGKTYFVRSAVSNGIVSEAVTRQQAEQELPVMNRSTRLVNRASGMQTCRYVGSGKDVTLIMDAVRFRFAGSSYDQMLPESQRKLDRLIDFTRRSNNVSSINLVGYTDGIGNSESNRRLSEARAETVRQALIGAGIDASIINVQGLGVAQTAGGCSKRQEDGCNKMSRRVDIMINSH
ncbi:MULTISPECIES: OmpA family protein [Tenebrionibacter/Tenebrionicola group]|jgi:OOP family OmpA-OmpF porin|uniref:OmpA family protein n=2 Tax=Tenebrionibacter/Tenebrionicola group TaxID=2969848 RepID=A0A8K0V9B3_9ENTR|nr:MULTISPECIES: OmpA family protein [Tenebrionibacter/Tenebrionicola group]MBK4716560.1 OmpA family protein [Tenebrionibacter intestinalis]MBV5097160.1 OmpA family protein [Tenebrionicola larvae]